MDSCSSYGLHPRQILLFVGGNGLKLEIIAKTPLLVILSFSL